MPRAPSSRPLQSARSQRGGQGPPGARGPGAGGIWRLTRAGREGRGGARGEGGAGQLGQYGTVDRWLAAVTPPAAVTAAGHRTVTANTSLTTGPTGWHSARAAIQYRRALHGR